MGRPLIYLAGPITGLTYAGATDWRDYVTRQLEKDGRYRCLSPMRAKDYLASEQCLGSHYPDYVEGIGRVLSDEHGIMGRDFFDANRCNLIFANLEGADKVSIGTVMEIAWGYARRVPIVLLMEDGNVHEHGMVRQATPFRARSMQQALDLVHCILWAE